MKTKILLSVILLGSTPLLPATTNNLTAQLQQGLMDEEANRDLNAAIADYQSLASQFDQDRQTAATAIYRLGECYRKLGRTNEAAAEYGRIVREFTDQQELVTLSRQNLVGLGVPAARAGLVVSALNQPSATNSPAQDPGTAADEAKLLAAQLAGIGQVKDDPEKRAFAVLALFPDDGLKDMLLNLPVLIGQRNALEDTNQTVNLVSLIPAVHPDEQGQQKMIRDMLMTQATNRADGLRLAQQEIKDQTDAIEQRIAFILNLQQARLQVLQSAAGLANSAGTPPVAPSTDEEAQEIIRIQEMIQNSPDLINAPGENGFTPLTKAAYAGWVKVAAYLLDHGADVNEMDARRDRPATSPLNAAASAGNRAMVELLLSRGAHVNAVFGQGSRTVLFTAVEDNFPAVTEVLLANHADVNAREETGNSPLSTAAISDHQTKIAQMLLSAGADPNQTNNYGGTPLSMAAIHQSPDFVKLLLDAKANPNVEDHDGRTPLSWATERNSTETVNLLLAAGANPNMGSYSRSPLSFAAERDAVDIVKLLLAAKADPNAGSIDAPLLGAIRKGDVELASVLLQAGADANAMEKTDWGIININGVGYGGNLPPATLTPLWYAVYQKAPLAMIQLLLKFKADPNDSRTDLQPIAFGAQNFTNTLAALLDAGADVNARDQRINQGVFMNATLLGSAVDNKLTDTVAFLLRRGANPNLADNYGNTPLHEAAKLLVDPSLFELLFAAKAEPNLRNQFGQTPLEILKAMVANVGPEQNALAIKLADLLRQHGALDTLPNWKAITVSRPSVHYSEPLLKKGTNDWNQLTLLELVALQCQLLKASPDDDNNSQIFPPNFFGQGQSLPFPDLTRLRIHRPAPDLKSTTDQTVDLEASLKSGDCSNDLPVIWGDVVEIPEADHPLNESWPGFSTAELTYLNKCLTRHVQVIIKGQTNALTLSLGIEMNDEGTGVGAILKKTFWLRPVLMQSKLVLASSDLSRVKVTRRDSATGHPLEWIVDCSAAPSSGGMPGMPGGFYAPRSMRFGGGGGGPGSFAPAEVLPSNDFWLRDGDVVRVPDRL